MVAVLEQVQCKLRVPFSVLFTILMVYSRYIKNFEAINEVHVCVDAMDGPQIVPVSVNLESADIYLDGPGCIHGRP